MSKIASYVKNKKQIVVLCCRDIKKSLKNFEENIISKNSLISSVCVLLSTTEVCK